jgi:hypothetical protein
VDERNYLGTLMEVCRSLDRLLRGEVRALAAAGCSEAVRPELTGDIVKLIALPGSRVPASFASSVEAVAGARSHFTELTFGSDRAHRPPEL